MWESQFAKNKVWIKRVLGHLGSVFRDVGLDNYFYRSTFRSNSKEDTCPALTLKDALWAVDNWDALVAEREVVTPISQNFSDSVIDLANKSPENEKFTVFK